MASERRSAANTESNTKYHRVIRFLTLENVTPCEMHRRLIATYGSPVISVQAARK